MRLPSACLFGFVFPAASSTIALGYSGGKFGLSEVLLATARIYWLDGVIWEGPKLALEKLAGQQSSIIQLITGTALYLVIIANLKSALWDKLSNDELRNAAMSKLAIGDLSAAERLIDNLPEDDSATWDSRITHSLMAGDVDAAQAFCKSKKSELGIWIHNINVSCIAYLALLSLSWQTEKSTQEKIWNEFIAAKPSELEFMWLWFALSQALETNAYFYSESVFVRFSQDSNYFHSHLNWLIIRGRFDDPAPALGARAASESSLSPPVRLFTEVGMLIGLYQVSPTEVDESLILQILANFSQMIIMAKDMCGLTLVALSLDIFSYFAQQQGSEMVGNWLAKEDSLLKARILMLPQGQAMFAALRAIQDQVRPSISRLAAQSNIGQK